ncbi:phage tail protein [Viridibacillus arvi]|uniref:phage tail protein n=1 Tax=Viridibacillus arvi TaxID=263475 RepID=UPI0038088DFC
MRANFQATVGARITEFMARMRQVQNTIRTTANDVHINVDADISQFRRRMAEIQARMRTLARERVIIKIEARIEEFQRRIGRIATNIRAFGELAANTLQGAMISVLPAIAPIIANIGGLIGSLGPMIGTVAGSTLALGSAFTAAGVGAGAFGAVAIPTIKALFKENAKLNAEQTKAKASFDNFKSSYDGLVNVTEKPVLSAFTKFMNISNGLLGQLKPMFLSSAKAVDGLMTSLSKSIGTPPIQKFIEYLNTSAAPMLTTFGQAFGNVFKGIASTLTAIAPLSESTAQGFLNMTKNFAGWAAGLDKSAKFQAFMEYVNTNMPKIRAIFRDATAGVVYFFSAFGGMSSGMMTNLADLMVRFKEWSKSLSTNQGFQQFASYVEQTAPTIMSLIGNITKFLVNMGIGMAPLGAAILVIADKFLTFINNLMEGNRAIGVIMAGLISFGGILLATVPNIIAFSALFSGMGGAIIKGLGKALPFIGGLFTNFSGTILPIVTHGLRSLVTAFGLITSPVGIVIGVIATLIAIFVNLYKTNETFRTQVQTIWSAIKDAISQAVTAIWTSIQSIWSQIMTFWNENQASIKATASTVWNAISTVITTVMSAVMSIMTFIWPAVKALIVSTWNAIMNVIQGAIDVILGIVKTFSSLFQGDWKGVWEGVKQILSGALQLIWGAVNLYFVGKLLGPLKGFASQGKTLIQAAWTAIKSIFTNTLNTIKSFVTTSFNAIKSSIQTVMNAIKTVIQTIWNAIKSIFSSVISAIRSAVTAGFNAIRSTIQSVMATIRSVITTIWNAIKSTVTSVVNAIKSTVVSIFNSLSSSVSKAMDAVKTAVETGWNKAKSFLEGINLITIGKNIVQGLINGIGSMMDSVKSKVAEIANSIPAGIKKLLGIHSPSRVAIKLGGFVGQGLANGIAASAVIVATATKKIAKAAVPNFKETANLTKAQLQSFNKVIANTISNNHKEIAKIEKNAENKRATVTKNAEKRIKTIRLNASKQRNGLTTSQERQITEIQRKASDQRATITSSANKKIASIEKSSHTNRMNALKKFADNQVKLGKMTTAQEVAYWSKAADEFKKGSQERITAQINAKEAQSKLLDEQLEKEKSYIEGRKNLNKLSLIQELSAYESYMKQYKKGSEQRKYYEEQIGETKQKIHDKLIALNEEYTTKIQEANQKLIDGERELTAEYQDAVKSRAEALYGFSGLFDEIAEKSDVSGQQLVANLKGQVESFKSWAANIQALASKGIDEGLLAELRAMGPSAGAEIAALNTLSSSELTEYQGLWKEKTKLARTTAVAEMEGLRVETEQKIKTMRSDTATQLTTYNKEWQKQIKEVTTGTKKEFNALTASMPSIGKNVIKGMQSGLTDMTPSLLKQANSIANSIKSTIQKALDIHSPSRWGRDMIGKNMVKGISIGMQSMKGLAIKTANQVADWIKPELDLGKVSFAGADSIGLNMKQLKKDIEQELSVDLWVHQEGGAAALGGINQELHLHSPVALSPAENARQSKRQLQKLATQFM